VLVVTAVLVQEPSTVTQTLDLLVVVVQVRLHVQLLPTWLQELLTQWQLLALVRVETQILSAIQEPTGSMLLLAAVTGLQLLVLVAVAVVAVAPTHSTTIQLVARVLVQQLPLQVVQAALEFLKPTTAAARAADHLVVAQAVAVVAVVAAQGSAATAATVDQAMGLAAELAVVLVLAVAVVQSVTELAAELAVQAVAG
jgi:hypothetical protein